jgi:hypothetical protein
VLLVQHRLGGGVGGWLVLSSGVVVVLMAVSGFFRDDAEARRSGLLTWCQEHMVGMVLIRAEAFTDITVRGDGGGALVASFYLLGAPL